MNISGVTPAGGMGGYATKIFRTRKIQISEKQPPTGGMGASLANATINQTIASDNKTS